MTRCPYCHVGLDAALNLDGRREPRDWTPVVCPWCCGLAVFDRFHPGGTRPPDKADWDAWALTPRLVLGIAQTMHTIRLLMMETEP
jgi:hypothetical protein